MYIEKSFCQWNAILNTLFRFNVRSELQFTNTAGYFWQPRQSRARLNWGAWYDTFPFAPRSYLKDVDAWNFLEEICRLNPFQSFLGKTERSTPRKNGWPFSWERISSPKFLPRKKRVVDLRSLFQIQKSCERDPRWIHFWPLWFNFWWNIKRKGFLVWRKTEWFV